MNDDKRTESAIDDLLDDIRWAEQNVAEAEDELDEARKILWSLQASLRQRESELPSIDDVRGILS